MLCYVIIQMYLWLDTEKGMEFRRQVPVRLSQPPWNNDEALTKNISVFQRCCQSIDECIVFKRLHVSNIMTYELRYMFLKNAPRQSWRV